MRPAQALAVVLVAAAILASAARADYAVLRSGVKLHITGYQQDGDRVRLAVAGGSIEIAADDLAWVEPEEVFQAVSPLAPPDGPFGKLIRESAARNGVDEKLITQVIAAESAAEVRGTLARDPWSESHLVIDSIDPWTLLLDARAE